MIVTQRNNIHLVCHSFSLGLHCYNGTSQKVTLHLNQNFPKLVELIVFLSYSCRDVKISFTVRDIKNTNHCES